MKFTVTYRETLERTYIIDAEDAEEAEDIMLYLVNEEDIVLDADDFVDGEFDVDIATDGEISFFDNVEDEFEESMRMYRGDEEDF